MRSLRTPSLVSSIRKRRSLGSQGGFTLVETLVAIAIAVIVIGPVGAWMGLIFTSQAPAAAGFTDAGQSRLLNTWVTRDVSSAEIVQTSDPAPAQPLVACSGNPESATVLMNLYDLGAEQRVVVYGLADGPGGSTSFYRWTCDLTVEHNVTDETEVLRDVVSVGAVCDVADPCRTVTVDAELSSGHSTSVTASRRGSAAALAGFGGSSRPVAVITQESRIERSPGQDLVLELSGASSWDPDTPSEDLSYAWSVSGPGTVDLSDTSGVSTTASISSEGSYSVQLSVRDPLGNRGQTTLAVPLVNLPPEVEQPDCQPAGDRTYTCSVVAVDSDTSSGVAGIDWSWPIDNAGTPGSGSGDSVTIVFPAALTAVPTVQVTVSDSEGGATVRSIELPLGAAPTGPIQISPAPVVSGNGLLQRVANTDQARVITFSTAATNFAGWELRDLGTDSLVDSATGPTWNKTFQAGTSGSFRLLRLAEDASAPVEEIFRVNAPPSASFVPPSTPAAAPQTLVFNDASTDDFGIAGQAWDFNYGFTGLPLVGSGSPVSVTYPNPGRYNVVLVVTDVDGLSATDFGAADVGGTPAQPAPPTWSANVVSFPPVAGATGYVVTFTYTGSSPACAKTVNVNVPAAGPLSATDNGNSCANPTGTSASVAVRANSATGPSSVGAVRPPP